MWEICRCDLSGLISETTEGGDAICFDFLWGSFADKRGLACTALAVEGEGS